jgi:hypothetical protein
MRPVAYAAVIGRLFGLIVTDMAGGVQHNENMDWVDPGVFALIGCAVGTCCGCLYEGGGMCMCIIHTCAPRRTKHGICATQLLAVTQPQPQKQHHHRY